MRHRSVLTVLLLALVLALARPLSCLAEEAAEPAATAVPYPGYVYVQCGEEYHWYPLPLPEQDEYEISVRQTEADGTELCNTLHFTHEGVYMAFSTCENQDCVGEGIVTLENREERVLGSWIVCLPQQVTVELFSAEELMAMLAGGQ